MLQVGHDSTHSIAGNVEPSACHLGIPFAQAIVDIGIGTSPPPTPDKDVGHQLKGLAVFNRNGGRHHAVRARRPALGEEEEMKKLRPRHCYVEVCPTEST
jgi:hypothetical protein